MITTILFYIISFILYTFATLSNLIFRGFSLWPDSVLSTLKIFFVSLYKFDMILNISPLLGALKFFLSFLTVWYSFLLLSMIFNFFRGSGKIGE